MEPKLCGLNVGSMLCYQSLSHHYTHTKTLRDGGKFQTEVGTIYNKFDSWQDPGWWTEEGLNLLAGHSSARRWWVEGHLWPRTAAPTSPPRPPRCSRGTPWSPRRPPPPPPPPRSRPSRRGSLPYTCSLPRPASLSWRTPVCRCQTPCSCDPASSVCLTVRQDKFFIT